MTIEESHVTPPSFTQWININQRARVCKCLWSPGIGSEESIQSGLQIRALQTLGQGYPGWYGHGVWRFFLYIPMQVRDFSQSIPHIIAATKAAKARQDFIHLTTCIPSNALISTPFFRKQCFSLKYVLGTLPQNFWRYVKIRNICDIKVQFTILTVQGP